MPTNYDYSDRYLADHFLKNEEFLISNETTKKYMLAQISFKHSSKN